MRNMKRKATSSNGGTGSKKARSESCPENSPTITGKENKDKESGKNAELAEEQCSTSNNSDSTINDEDELVEIVTDKANFDETFVQSSAFIDKSQHIRSLYGPKSLKMKTSLITAPSRMGKSTNMNMVWKFMEVVVDNNGFAKVNVEWDDEAKRWVEKDQREQTDNFKLFKRLKIFQCQCIKVKNRKNNQHTHTEEECMTGACPGRNFFYQRCGKTPVIRVSFEDVSCASKKEFESTLRRAIRETFLHHRYLCMKTSCRLSSSAQNDFNRHFDDKEKKHDVAMGLKILADCLYEQFKEPIFVLVEEFDAPITLLLENSSKIPAKLVIETIGKMLKTVLKGHAHVGGALVNACVQVEHALSPYANNVSTYPFLENHLFSEYCGFTGDEVKELLARHVFRNLDKVAIKDFYNGYKIHGGGHLFCTYSVLKYLQGWADLYNIRKKRGEASPTKTEYPPTKFWIQSYGVTQLEDLFRCRKIRQCIEKLLAEKEIIITLPSQKMSIAQVKSLQQLLESSDTISDRDVQLFIHYLRDRGYFNIVKKTTTHVHLEVPNSEVAMELRNKLFSPEYYKSLFKVRDDSVTKYLEALKSLDGEKKSLEKFALSVSNLFPSKLPQRHDEVKGVLFAFAFLEYDVFCEPFCVQNRGFCSDIVVIRNDGVGIIIEVSSCRKNADEALKQIFKNKYYMIFANYYLNKKMYIGLHYDYQSGIVDMSAFATAGKVVTTALDPSKNNNVICANAERCRK